MESLPDSKKIINEQEISQNDFEDDFDEEEFRKSKKLMSKVVAVLPSQQQIKQDSINEITGDVFNLNSLDSSFKSHFHGNERSKSKSRSKRKSKKSKHSRKKRTRYTRSRTKSRSKSKLNNSHNSKQSKNSRRNSISSVSSYESPKRSRRSRSFTKSPYNRKSNDIYVNNTNSYLNDYSYSNRNYSNRYEFDDFYHNPNFLESPNKRLTNKPRFVKTPPLPDEEEQPLKPNDSLPEQNYISKTHLIKPYVNNYHRYHYNINQTLPNKNNLILIQTEDDNFTRSPINQCHEISSSSNLNYLENIDSKKFKSIEPTKCLNDIKNQEPGLKENLNKPNEDDFAALKDKFRMQLKEHLFDKNGKELEDNIITKDSSSNTSLTDIKKEQFKDDKKKNKHHHKHHKSSHHHHRKHKKEKKAKKEKSDNDSDFSEENENENSAVRRSDRIKVIETKKQHHKELEIAEKLKKHNDFDTQTDSSQTLNEKITQSNKILDSPSDFESSKSDQFIWPSDYQQIDENSYFTKKNNNKNKESKKMICDCSTSEQERQMGYQACGADCLNRMLLIECGKRCPCGEFCTNRNFKTKNNAKITPFKTELKGWGLKTFTDLKPGAFLIEYVGEVIDLKEFKKRCEKYADQNNQHFYFMSLQNDLFIDATKKGNMSRFFNHSCDPNCETQKWTVNGELRIGFFTRRSVSANEELTFDYQFQTVGKKQQKCYCGSEKCRGYLGASSNNSQNQLNYIWEDEDTSNSEQSSQDSSTEGSQSDTEKPNIKKFKKQKISRDFDLNRQINSIRSLSNKENVLKLCQLMFRTENLDMRLSLLNLLLDAKSEMSLRLFMDYHGLKLIWGWMVDIDSLNESISHLECKLKILEVLSKLPIKNRTILEEFKLLTIVKRWSESQLNLNFDFTNLDSEDDVNSWVFKIIENIVSKSVEESEKKSDENYKTLLDLFEDLKLKSKNLFEEWSNLKQAFKIPKKQQIEERKEHERELNKSSKELEKQTPASMTPSELNSPQISTYPNHNRHHYYNNNYKDNRYYKTNKNYDKTFYKKKSFNSYNQDQNSSLSKEQRRQLFEQKVREEEEKAAAQAKAAAEAEAQAQAELKLKNQQEFKWMFDSSTNQWIQCYVTVNPQVMPVVQSVPVYNQSQYNYYNNTNSINTYPIAVPPPPKNETLEQHINRINLSDTHFKDLKEAVEQFKSKEENEKNSISKKTPNSNLKSLSAIAAKLPPNWKCKRNSKGLIYYYNIKTKKTQWTFPKASKTSPLKQKVKKDKTETKDEEEVEEEKKLEMTDEKKDTDAKNVLSSVSNISVSQTELKEKSDSNEASSTGSNLISNSTSSEIFKIYKDQFREKLSRLVIKLLQPYLSKDCPNGHIQNTADFKHLARKFTHTIMEKEMSRATKLEELDLDKRIKVKTQDYVTRYMQKFKGVYCRLMDGDSKQD